jgi:hypothetical protein
MFEKVIGHGEMSYSILLKGERMSLSRPTYNDCTLQFVILLRSGFNHVKILDWNVNKSASRLYIDAPKVE